jgi:hypothetical protein
MMWGTYKVLTVVTLVTRNSDEAMAGFGEICVLQESGILSQAADSVLVPFSPRNLVSVNVKIFSLYSHFIKFAI